MKERDKNTNPFSTLRDPRTGQIDQAQMAKVESFLKIAGTKATISLARSAGVRLDGSPINEAHNG
jgi:hypothetical protein